MKKKDFTDAGFEELEDPHFTFEFSLRHANQDPDAEGPALLYDVSSGQFCITEDGTKYVYFNAESPAEARDWAKKITSFSDQIKIPRPTSTTAILKWYATRP